MIHIIPTLEDNYSYIVECDDKALVIDCGDAAPVINFLDSKKLKLEKIILTHHHWDHIDGIKDLKNHYSDIDIAAPEKHLHRITFARTAIKNSQVLFFGPYSFQAIETPGHTQNHLCYYSKELNALFSGDTLFSAGCGRLFEGTPEDMFQSLQRLKQLQPETLIYCGHEYTVGNLEFGLSIEPHNNQIKEALDQAKKLREMNKPTIPTTLARELETNLFLKAKTAGEFARLRELRNNF